MKHLCDVDCYEKETAVLECQFNYDDAPVTWFKDDMVSFFLRNFFTCDIFRLLSHLSFS